ncbi:hypothetical protein B0T20DRAFT_396475 [Sordaria brevicollis]|uniref:C2H2-type domain-containing protein n=1 Tax=Sordaria brevicollis TaxID=83679 RepID=A0AAE0P240_SORBR|nr:hypothetical protein B0T20DRAFT_396475 [Sordaria brevicollis]
MECPRGVHPSIIEEELEAYNAKRKQRAKRLWRLASIKKRQVARERDLEGYLRKNRMQDRRYTRKNRQRLTAARHKRIENNVARQRFHCKLCNHSFPTLYNLIRHQTLNEDNLEKAKVTGGGKPREQKPNSNQRKQERRDWHRVNKTFFCETCGYTGGNQTQFNVYNNGKTHRDRVAGTYTGPSQNPSTVRKRELAARNKAEKRF